MRACLLACLLACVRACVRVVRACVAAIGRILSALARENGFGPKQRARLFAPVRVYASLTVFVNTVCLRVRLWGGPGGDGRVCASAVRGSPKQQARLREAGMTARDIERDPEHVMEVPPPPSPRSSHPRVL